MQHLQLALLPLSPSHICRDLRLTVANTSRRIWDAAGDERSAMQRHKPPVLAAGAAATARGRAKARAGHSGSAALAPQDAAAAATAAWAAASPDVTAVPRERVAAALR